MFSAKDEDSINKVYDKYQVAKQIRNTYWSELCDMIGGLQGERINRISRRKNKRAARA